MSVRGTPVAIAADSARPAGGHSAALAAGEADSSTLLFSFPSTAPLYCSRVDPSLPSSLRRTLTLTLPPYIKAITLYYFIPAWRTVVLLEGGPEPSELPEV